MSSLDISIVVYAFTISVGAAAIITLIFIYKNNNDKSALHGALFFIWLTINLCIAGMGAFITHNRSIEGSLILFGLNSIALAFLCSHYIGAYYYFIKARFKIFYFGKYIRYGMNILAVLSFSSAFFIWDNNLERHTHWYYQYLITLYICFAFFLYTFIVISFKTKEIPKVFNSMRIMVDVIIALCSITWYHSFLDLKDFWTHKTLPITFFAPNIMYVFLVFITVWWVWKYYFSRYQKKHTVISEISIKNEYKLTPTELRVFKLVLEGKAHKEIAEELEITTSTVKNHISKITKKTNTKNKTEIIKKFA